MDVEVEMAFTTLLALGWPGIARLSLSPLGALESFLGAVAIVALTLWLCGESVRQRAEQRRIDAQAADEPAPPHH